MDKLKEATPPMDEVIAKLKELAMQLSDTDCKLQKVVNKLGAYTADTEMCEAGAERPMPDYAQYETSTTLYQLNELCDNLDYRYRRINALTNQLQYFIG